MYPSKWTGSTDPNDKSGVAEFKVEGVDYALHLDCFTDYQVLSEMLEAAFDQGKSFAATLIIDDAMDISMFSLMPMACLTRNKS